MKAWRWNNAVPPQLIQVAVPVPTPGRGELLIRVQAAGVTPTEVGWYPTTHTADGGVRTGAIPGHEFSGVVEKVGGNVDPVWLGQEVYGMNDWFIDGATTEYVLTLPAFIAEKPKRLSPVEAASVPIGALTAWQGLFDHARLQKGERVLIHGGAGAVGVWALQFARRTGAHVITTASARNIDFLRKLGADAVIDYRAEQFEDRAGKFDVIFDAVGGQVRDRSWKVLNPKGRLVTIAAGSEGTKDARIEQAFFIVEPNANQLKEVSRLLDNEELLYFVDAEVPFAEAPAAYGGKIENRLGRGKIVISL
jgi:NADPH:quinone reductase-like Zn-dependent oxidoreductase